jgi:hypothetical protein
VKVLLSKSLVRMPNLGSKLLFYSFAFLIVGQVLDGVTTKVGLDLGLAEVGVYAMPVLGSLGFWGLMVWKCSIIAGLGLMYLLVYYGAKKYDPAHLKLVTMILTVGCLIGIIATIQIDVSNIHQIQIAYLYR